MQDIKKSRDYPTPTPQKFGIRWPKVSAKDLVSSLLLKTPGTLAVYSNAFENYVWSLPLLKYISPYRTIKERIAALKKL